MVPAMNCFYVIGSFFGWFFLIFGYLGICLCLGTNKQKFKG